MTTVNNVPDTAAKANSLVSNILSSLQASFGQNSAIESLFANFLSQTNLPVTPPPQSQQQQSANTAKNAPTPQNSSADDTNPGPFSTPAVSKTPSGWTQIGKSPRQKTQSNASKSTQQKSTDDSSPSSSVNANATATVTQAPDKNAAANASSGSASQNNNQDTTNSGGDNVHTPDPNADAPPTFADAAEAAATAAANTPAVNTPAPAATTPADQTAATDTDTNAGSGASNPASDLIALILQLEHLAAAQAAALQAPTATDASAAAASQSTPGGPSQNPAADPGKIDLKALLAAIADMNNNGDGSTGDATATGDQTDASTAFSAAVAASSAPQASGTPQAQQTTDKLASTDFFNLFAAANNQNNAAPPVAPVNPVAGAALASGGGDGGTLNSGADGQTGTGTRDAATAAADSTKSPLAAGQTQTSNPYDFASQLSALRATKGGPTGLPTPVEQVVLQLSRGLSKDGSSQMTIQLKPAELGRVDIKLNIGSDGKVQGTVTADNSSTLGLLLKDARGLERALQEAGLRADPGSLQFNLRGDQQGNGFGQSANNQSGSGGGDTGGAFDASASLGAYAGDSETYYLTPGGVNMRV